MTVSIHARVRRATALIGRGIRGRGVSIHARVRRATPAYEVPAGSAESFNPRPRTAGDAFASLFDDTGIWFQSTPAYGGRRSSSGGIVNPAGFQSTPAYGGRLGNDDELAAGIMFQSTPAYGGRPDRSDPRRRPFRVSIHARVRRATGVSRPQSSGTDGFNPRPRTAGDDESCCCIDP